MLLVTRLFDSLPLVMTHDQHDEDMARHQLQAKRIVKCIGRRRNRSRRTRRRLKQVLPRVRPVARLPPPGPTGTGTTLRISTTAAVVVRNVPPGICTTVPVA